MTATVDRMAVREERLAKVADQLAIYQLSMTYGPSADSGSDDVVRTLYTEDAEYDSGLETFYAADGVAEMIGGLPLHATSWPAARRTSRPCP
jgi:hypothetical protein